VEIELNGESRVLCCFCRSVTTLYRGLVFMFLMFVWFCKIWVVSLILLSFFSISRMF
jgi:hypothetical protein